MKRTKRIILFLLKLGVILYVILAGILYFFQEKVLFHPKKIDVNKVFAYKNAKEVWVPVDDTIKIHGLWFQDSKNKKVILYLHGNGGNMNKVGYLGEHYNSYQYDFFAIDYRGFGKSEGEIVNEDQFYNDAQKALEYLKKSYSNDEIVVMGYSIGTATAAKLAADNEINQLILLAPYYSMANMKNERYLSWMPSSLIRYPFETFRNLEKVEEPITVFHGINDRVIHFSNSELLKEKIPRINLYPLDNQGHGGIFFHDELEKRLRNVLKN